MGFRLQGVDEHPDADHDEQDGEALLELGDGQGLGQPRAEGRGEHAHRHDAEKRGQVEVAERVGQQPGIAPAVDQIAEAARGGDGEADGGGGADGLAHVHVVPEQEGDGERAPADAHEARHHADDAARRAHARRAGEVAGGLGLPAADHLRDQSLTFDCCCNTMLLLSTEGSLTLAFTDVEIERKCTNSKKVNNDLTFM